MKFFICEFSVHGKKLKKQVNQGLDLLDYYNEYYSLECPDGTYILAQLPDKYARAIAKGEKVTLPIGYKEGITNTAKK